MVKSEVNLYFLPEDYRQAWYDYWQKVAVTSQLMKDKKVNLSDTKQNWKSDWKKEIVPFLTEVAEWGDSGILFAAVRQSQSSSQSRV